MAIKSSDDFFHLWTGVFHISLRTHKNNVHNREGGRKENKQTQTWVSSKFKKREVCDTFPAFSELSRACIRAKFPQNHQEFWLILSRWPTQPLSPHILAVTFLDRQLPPTSVDCPVLSTGLCFQLLCSASFSWLVWDLPSFVPFRSNGKSRAQALCMSFVPKHTRNLLSGTYPHPQKWMPPIVSHFFLFPKLKMCLKGKMRSRVEHQKLY